MARYRNHPIAAGEVMSPSSREARLAALAERVDRIPDDRLRFLAREGAKLALEDLQMKLAAKTRRVRADAKDDQ